MNSSAIVEEPLGRESKRKARRTTTSSSDYSERQSIKDPRIFKQLLKNNEKHDVPRIVEDLKEDKKHGIGQPSTSRKQPKRSYSERNMIEENPIQAEVRIEIPLEFEKKFIENFKEFHEMYKEVADDPNTDTIAEPLDYSVYEDEKQMKLLVKLYYLCEENYYEANAVQLWKDLPKCFTSEEMEIMEQDPKVFYQAHLFFFDRFHKSNKSQEALKDILKLEPELLTDPQIEYASQVGQDGVTPEFLEKVSLCQIALLKDFVNLIGIDPELFNIENVEQNYPDEIIDIVYQNPDLYGFVQDPKKTVQYRKKMTIEDYYYYQRECMIKMPQNVRDKDGMIKFAVNIDINDWEDHISHLEEKVPPEWLYNSEKDGMSFINQKIKGINQPQLYLKVEGAWTGGHEENLRLRAVNFNHGPDSCVWYTIGTEYAPQFRKLVKESYNLDIHKDEGLWFADIDLCIKNNIKIQYFVQEPGDVVLLGPGCIHWVRCLGITMNTAWNMCTKDKFQFEKAFERMEINKEINFKNLVPIKQVAAEVLFNDTFTISEDFQDYLVNKMREFYEEEMKICQNYLKKQPNTVFAYEGEGSSVYNCIMCNSETICFYIYCDACSQVKKPKKIVNIICLKCIPEHVKHCKNENKQYFHYCKFSETVLADLLKLLHNFKEEKDQIAKNYKNLSEYFKQIIDKDIKIKDEKARAANAHKTHENKPQKINQKNSGHSMKRELSRKDSSNLTGPMATEEKSGPRHKIQQENTEQSMKREVMKNGEDTKMIIEEEKEVKEEKVTHINLDDQTEKTIEKKKSRHKMIIEEEYEETCQTSESKERVADKSKETKQIDKTSKVSQSQSKDKKENSKQEKENSHKEVHKPKKNVEEETKHNKERNTVKTTTSKGSHEDERRESTKKSERKPSGNEMNHEHISKKSQSVNKTVLEKKKSDIAEVKPKSKSGEKQKETHFVEENHLHNKDKEKEKEKKREEVEKRLQKEEEIPEMNTKRNIGLIEDEMSDDDTEYTIKKKHKSNEETSQEQPSSDKKKTDTKEGKRNKEKSENKGEEGLHFVISQHQQPVDNFFINKLSKDP